MAAPRSYYLGPRQSRLLASIWADVVAAASSGILDETHWVELKQAIPASNKPANLELARDLASLSVDGGVLIVGVKDAGGAAGAVVGTPLGGLASRIDQVAATTVSPPLHVTIDELASPDNPDVGLMIVTVPASAGAPHMVDGNYWGRGDTGKRTLQDGDVRRLLDDRLERSRGFHDRLLAVREHLDPAGERVGRSRMYLLLEPAGAAREPLSEVLASGHLLHETVAAVTFHPTWSPSLHSLNHSMPHPDGVAAASLPPGDASPSDPQFLAVLLADDGSVKLTSPGSRPRGRDTDAPEVISPGALLEMVHAALLFAGHVAAQHMGYAGAWTAGVFLDQLRGQLPSQAYDDFGFGRFAPFPKDDYIKVVSTTTREMQTQPAEVVTRLMKPLLRGLGVDKRFLPYEHPAELTQRV